MFLSGRREKIQWGRLNRDAAGKQPAHDTCEVISVHSMEQQETDEEDESEASDDHATQRETVAAFGLNDLGDNNK